MMPIMKPAVIEQLWKSMEHGLFVDDFICKCIYLKWWLMWFSTSQQKVNPWNFRFVPGFFGHVPSISWRNSSEDVGVEHILDPSTGLGINWAILAWRLG